MTTETKLRDALNQRAQAVPAASIAKLRAHDYHPRTRRLRPPMAIGAVGAATTAGAVAAIVSLTAGASSAFAGWSTTPTKASPNQFAAAAANCQSHLSSGLPLVLTDTRGPFTFQVYADSKTSRICTTGPSFQSVASSQSSAPVTVPDDQIEAQIAHGANENGHGYSFGDGRVGADVTGLTLVLKDGTDVTATVQGGWFVAWWPGDSAAASAEITTSAGTRTEKLNDNVPPAPPGGASGQATFSSSGSASGSGQGEGGMTSSSFRSTSSGR